MSKLNEPWRGAFQRLARTVQLSCRRPVVSRLVWGCAIALGCGVATPGFAAERLTLRLGPIEQSVAIADLEHFAETGEIRPGLKLYSPALTPSVRKALSDRLELDPKRGEEIVDELLSSPAGKKMLETLKVAVPNSSVEQLQAAVILAAEQANGLSVIDILKAFPAQTITIDVTAAATIASQINLSYWETKALGPLLERELAVPEAAFTPLFDPTASGLQAVQKRTFVFEDEQRDRKIVTDLYWTETPEDPLIVISHGFGANRTFLAYLARHLASYGFTVAAIEHPGSTIAWMTSSASDMAPGSLLSAAEFVERPQDVSFLLDELEKLNRKEGPLKGKLPTEQVSVIGHSLGGYTALALAGAQLQLDELRKFCKERIPLGLAPADWLQCTAVDLPERQLNLQDRRVVQAVALNPVIGQLFGQTGIAQIEVPTLILAGTEDALTPALSHQLQPFNQLRGNKYLVTAIGGTHLSVGDPANFSGIVTQSTVVRERRGEDTENLRRFLQGVSLAFVKQLTPEAEAYQPFLTPAYAQSLSTASLPLRLNTKLPASLAPWLRVADRSQKPLNAQVEQRVSALAYYFVACNTVLYTVGSMFGRFPGQSRLQLRSRNNFFTRQKP